MAHRVGIALGANLGDRLKNLCDARDQLRALASADACFLQASVYESEPVDCADDAPAFLNTVLEMEYTGEPEQLLQSTQGIELELGRDAEHGYNAPRLIDVDILYFGDRQVHQKNLTIPHPRMLERRFVLQPLNEIRPDLEIPTDGVTVAEYFRQLDSDEPPLRVVQAEW